LCCLSTGDEVLEPAPNNLNILVFLSNWPDKGLVAAVSVAEELALLESPISSLPSLASCNGNVTDGDWGGKKLTCHWCSDVELTHIHRSNRL
jgi:hypothetical protein